MRLTSIDLAGFGCLRDFQVDFATGLNVFHGLNEAGKSTLQQGISALLYGFYDADRARHEETSRHERFRPWDGGVYRGSLQYEMNDGRRFEVRRDYATADVPTQLIDLVTGEDVAPQFGKGRHGNIPFARRHLGMSRTVFQSCAFISQGEIFHVAENGPKEIADAVAALADNAGRDVSAARALERLKSAISRIGSDRARTAELPKAREELSRVTGEIEAIDASRRSLAARASELDRLESRLSDLTKRVQQTEYAFMSARVGEISERLQALRSARESLAKATAAQIDLRPYSQFPVAQRDDLLALRAKRESAQKSIASTQEALSAPEIGISQAERAEFETLRTTVGDLGGDRLRSLEAIAFAREQGWLSRAIDRVVRQVSRVARSAWRWVFRRPNVAESDSAGPELNVSRDDAISLLERHRRYLTLAPAIERLSQLQRRMDSDEGDLASSEARLVALLEDAGVYREADIEGSSDTFLAACKKREDYERADAASAEAERRVEIICRGQTDEALAADLDACRRRADEISAGLGPSSSIDERPSGELARELDGVRLERAELELQVERLREEVRLTMSQHRSRAEVEEDTGHWEARVEELERAREALRTAAQTIDEAMVAVYRDFAPAVNTFLSEGIERVTDGRYSRAHVDPATLSISLLVPETGQVITDPPVSHGTRTLAYILMRIGLAQHMSSVGEPVPLVLDDPFVDVDEERLPKILDYLVELSDRIQVLIFTKDRAVLDWFDGRLLGDGHRVHLLSSRQTAAAL